MNLVLISGAMLFATLFMGYAIYRSSATFWPPMGTSRTDLTLPFISTLLITLSSWFCYQVSIKVKAGKMASARTQLNLTLALGFGFLVVQSLLWSHLKAKGVFVSSGIFASTLYGFTWIHAGHMILGLSGLIYLRVVLNKEDANVLQKSINVEKFWHFLGVIWIIMFLTLFVL